MPTLGRVPEADAYKILGGAIHHFLPTAFDDALKQAGIDPSLVAAYKEKVLPALTQSLVSQIIPVWTKGGVYISVLNPSPTYIQLVKNASAAMNGAGQVQNGVSANGMTRIVPQQVQQVQQPAQQNPVGNQVSQVEVASDGSDAPGFNDL